MGEHRVVAAGAVRPQGHRHRLVQGPRGELLADHEQPRDPDPLVVRRQLVAGQREPGVVPADADPRPDAEREHHRLARARATRPRRPRPPRPSTRSLVWATQRWPSARGRRPDDQVRAAAVDGLAARSPARAGRSRSPRSRPRTAPADPRPAPSAAPSISSTSHGVAAQRRGAVARGEGQLLVTRAARPAGRRRTPRAARRTAPSPRPTGGPTSRWAPATTQERHAADPGPPSSAASASALTARRGSPAAGGSLFRPLTRKWSNQSRTWTRFSTRRNGAPERVSSWRLVGDAHEADRPLERPEHREQRLGLADRAAQVVLRVLDQQRRVDLLGVGERRESPVEVRVLPRLRAELHDPEDRRRRCPR